MAEKNLDGTAKKRQCAAPIPGMTPEKHYLTIVRLASHVTVEHTQSAAFFVHNLPHALESSTAAAHLLLAIAARLVS
jgi:hypothetical protein